MKYRKFKPPVEEFTANTARARLRFAATAILNGVHESRRKWSWEHFAERRDDRQKYVDLFQKKLLKTLAGSVSSEACDTSSLYLFSGKDIQELNALERKLSYEDLRFYRSIARSRLRKDTALRKRLEAEKAKQQQGQSWTSWLWGSSSSSDSTQDDALFGGSMSEEQRKELYEVLDYDEKSAVLEALQTPRDSLKARIVASLNRGSFTLNSRSNNLLQEIMSINFDSFQAHVLQRPDNLEASASLGGFGIIDGTTQNSVHPQIVQVKDSSQREDTDDPFLFIKFESNPLDERADNALTVRMRHMEIIYHKGYVEAIYKFFKPPESQLESVEALLVCPVNISPCFDDLSTASRVLPAKHSKG